MPHPRRAPGNAPGPRRGCIRLLFDTRRRLQGQARPWRRALWHGIYSVPSPLAACRLLEFKFIALAHLAPRSVRPSADAAPVDVSRRALLALAAVVAGSPGAGAASAAAGKEVGNYLPPAGVDDFVRYVPGPRATPAIRAGTVKPDRPYTFILPASWSEASRL